MMENPTTKALEDLFDRLGDWRRTTVVRGRPVSLLAEVDRLVRDWQPGPASANWDPTTKSARKRDLNDEHDDGRDLGSPMPPGMGERDLSAEFKALKRALWRAGDDFDRWMRSNASNLRDGGAAAKAAADATSRLGVSCEFHREAGFDVPAARRAVSISDVAGKFAACEACYQRARAVGAWPSVADIEFHEAHAGSRLRWPQRVVS